MTIKYSPELLKDFYKLQKEFRWFMTINLLHADQDLQEPCQSKVRELIVYSLQNSAKFEDLIRTPLTSIQNVVYNKDRLIKNLNPCLTFFYDYICYAKPIITQCKPTLLKRLLDLEKMYSEFIAKYN